MRRQLTSSPAPYLTYLIHQQAQELEAPRVGLITVNELNVCSRLYLRRCGKLTRLALGHYL
jgi:hypothetical protein